MLFEINNALRDALHELRSLRSRLAAEFPHNPPPISGGVFCSEPATALDDPPMLILNAITTPHIGYGAEDELNVRSAVLVKEIAGLLLVSVSPFYRGCWHFFYVPKGLSVLKTHPC